MSTDNKFCKDCKHCIPDNPDIEFSKCALAPKEAVSERRRHWLVTGIGEEPTDENGEHFFCSTERGHLSGCGPEGSRFEPKVAS